MTDHHGRRMMFWKKGKPEAASNSDLNALADQEHVTAEGGEYECKDVNLVQLFIPFLKNLRSTKNPAKLPYPTCYYLPASSLQHMVNLQMSSIDLLINASMQNTPEERFLGVLKYCLSCCALTKFPYKPIIACLGETAHYSSGMPSNPTDRTYVVAEGVRKDPPYAIFHITNPTHGITYSGSCDLEPKFKQTSVNVAMKGLNKTVFNHPQGLFHEEYLSEVPDLAVRLLRMHTELVGDITVSSNTGYIAKITFKDKAMFGKAKNQINGTISFNGADVYTVDGIWDEVIYITDLRTHARGELLNRSLLVKCELVPAPLEHQLPSAGDRIWGQMQEALMKHDFESAAQIKQQININEVTLLNDSERAGGAYTPRHFRQCVNTGEWEILPTSSPLAPGTPLGPRV